MTSCDASNGDSPPLSLLLSDSILASDDPSGILKLGKTFIHGFSSLIDFLKAGIKHPPIIFNVFPAILLLVIILKPSMVEGTSL